jgi:hypothetical protein
MADPESGRLPMPRFAPFLIVYSHYGWLPCANVEDLPATIGMYHTDQPATTARRPPQGREFVLGGGSV